MTVSQGPSPISWPPSSFWDGDDGAWSSFHLRVGVPEQTVRVLPSTAGHATWVVLTDGCQPVSSTCSDSRGGLFNLTQSSSRNDLDIYTLQLELNFGRNEIGLYGIDTIALGLSDVTGGPTVNSQIVVGIETDRYRTGMFGLSQQPTNLTNFTSPHASFLTTLKTQNLIPSLSWAYTAGASYHPQGFLGSLTFGGSDRSRYTPNNVSFDLAPDVARDLVVGLQSVKSTYANGSSQALLPSPIMTFIDSTIPYIYLPVEACQTFERVLGLVWDPTNNLYLVDERLHQNLLNANPKFTFSIGNDKNSSPTVDIILPYASFDLVAEPPLLPNGTSYFPLRRAANDSQYTLDRTFLQEAYLIMNYEYNNFSVAQSRFDEGVPAQIIAIPSNNTAIHNKESHISRKAVISISIAVTVFVILIALALSFVIRRWWRNTKTRNSNNTGAIKPVREPEALTTIPTQEIGHDSLYGVLQELHDSGKVELLDEQSPSGSGCEINELPQSSPLVLHEPITRPDSQIAPMARNLNSTNRFPNFVSPETVGESWTNVRSAIITPYIESVINAPPRRLMLNVNKTLPLIPVSRIDSVIHSKFSPRNSLKDRNRTSVATARQSSLRLQRDSPSKELNRSLASTPISESPQVLPLVLSAENGFLARQRVQSLRSRPLTVEPTYATVFDYDSYKDTTVVDENSVDALRELVLRHLVLYH